LARVETAHEHDGVDFVEGDVEDEVSGERKMNFNGFILGCKENRVYIHCTIGKHEEKDNVDDGDNRGYQTGLHRCLHKRSTLVKKETKESYIE